MSFHQKGALKKHTTQSVEQVQHIIGCSFSFIIVDQERITERTHPMTYDKFLNLFLDFVPRYEVIFKSHSHGRMASGLSFQSQNFEIHRRM